MSYETIKSNFDRGLWSAANVALAVRKGLLTPAQYKEITGAEYQG